MSSPSAPSSSPQPAGVVAPRRCVLVIGIDGCRPDCLTITHAPTLTSLMTPVTSEEKTKTAFSLKSQVGDIGWSGPNWTSACTGVWRDKHGVSGNTFPTQQFDKYPSIFQRLKSFDSSAVTASCVNWKPLNDNILRPSDHPFTHEDDDDSVVASARRLLDSEERLDILFVHLDDVDAAGHAFDYGPTVPEYVEALKKTDDRISSILSSLRHRQSRYSSEVEDWLVVITTDHGGMDYTHEDGRPENRTNFLILHGSDVAPGEIFPSPVIADVAPTVLAHLGVKISSAWHLDGRPVGLKLTRRGHFMDLTKSQDPFNMFPIPKEELDAEGYAQHPTTGIAETN